MPTLYIASARVIFGSESWFVLEKLRKFDIHFSKWVFLNLLLSNPQLVHYVINLSNMKKENILWMINTDLATRLCSNKKKFTVLSQNMIGYGNDMNFAEKLLIFFDTQVTSNNRLEKNVFLVCEWLENNRTVSAGASTLAKFS